MYFFLYSFSFKTGSIFLFYWTIYSLDTLGCELMETDDKRIGEIEQTSLGWYRIQDWSDDYDGKDRNKR